MSTLDFSKLAGAPRGEAFEGLIRLMGEHLGMGVQWSGRGADGGRDLIFVETVEGPIKARSVRWLVSCKDNSDSNRSVTEREVGSITDKVKQHKCDGFLLATTTTASTGLKELLDKLDSAEGGRIQTKVWDRFELTRMLLSDQCAGLLLQFFPEHQHRQAVAKLDAAREIVETALPRFIVGWVRVHLVPAEKRWELLSGSKIWPHDAGQQAIIDVFKAHVSKWLLDLDEAPKQTDKLDLHVIKRLDLDAFMAFCDVLIRNFPKSAVRFLKEITKTPTDYRLIYNAIEMLRESVNFTFDDELAITCNYDSGALCDLYSQIVIDEIDFLDWHHRIGDYVSGGDLDLKRLAINELIFEGGQDGISFSANIEITVTEYYHDRLSEDHSFFCKADGHLEGRLERTGVVFDSIECKRISMERPT